MNHFSVDCDSLRQSHPDGEVQKTWRSCLVSEFFLGGLGGGRAPEPEMTHEKTSLNKLVDRALRGRKFWVRRRARGALRRAPTASPPHPRTAAARSAGPPSIWQLCAHGPNPAFCKWYSHPDSAPQAAVPRFLLYSCSKPRSRSFGCGTPPCLPSGRTEQHLRRNYQ